MKKKDILSKTLVLAFFLGASIYLTSCTDDFSEEDFLKQQYELAEQKSAADQARELVLIALQHANALALSTANAQAQQNLLALQQLIAEETRAEFLEAYRNAGLLVKANIFILDAVNSTGVSGAIVSLFGKEATTSEQGIAHFTDIPIGAGNSIITADNYYTATSPAIIAYQEPSTAGPDGVPIQRTISANLKMVAQGSITNSSVIVNGTLTLDSDLTNAKTEFPKNATVNIDYETALKPENEGTGIIFISYQLENSDFQNATVNPITGKYSITVPAIDGIKLIMPILQQDITYIEENPDYNAFTNPDVDQYLIKKAPGTFDQNVIANSNYQAAISTFDLYKYEFEGLKGSGFDLSFKQLFNDLYDFISPQATIGHLQFSAGSGYSSIPTATLVSNGTDNIEDDKVYLTTDVVISSLYFYGGSNYRADRTTTHNIEVTATNSTGASFINFIGTIEVKADEYGNAISFENLSINENNPLSLSGINTIERYSLQGVAAADQPTSIIPTFESVVVTGINIMEGFTKGVYTSWPTVTFTGGSPAIPASFKIDANRSSLWKVSITNNGNLYDVLPEIKYTDINNNKFDLNNSSDNPIALNNLILNTEGTITLANSNLTTNYIRPSEIATVVEHLLPENSGIACDLDFTTHTNEDNNISAIHLNTHTAAYKTRPAHQINKMYSWVTDAVTPLELDITYYNDVAPISIAIKPSTGKGYMNPHPQVAVSNENYTISSATKGTIITMDCAYGVGTLND